MPGFNGKSVTVIGCGWLGYPLALDLLKKGYKVSVSLRDLTKSAKMIADGLCVYQLQLDGNTEILPEQNSDFWKSDVFIVTLPPSDPAVYPENIAKILNRIQSDNHKAQIIYTSSTGVYGKNIGTISENSVCNPDRAGAAAVLQAEGLFMGLKEKCDIIILRLAGLAGPGRNPGRFFAGKKNLGSGSTPINMVHLADCIAVVNCILEKNIGSAVFNICADKHPAHREFYPAQAAKLGLEIPEYGDDSPDADMKVIDNSLFKKLFGYQYLYPDPMEFSY